MERQHGGRHCPLPAVQRKYCAYAECFQWWLGDWKPCQTEVEFSGSLPIALILVVLAEQSGRCVFVSVNAGQQNELWPIYLQLAGSS